MQVSCLRSLFGSWRETWFAQIWQIKYRILSEANDSTGNSRFTSFPGCVDDDRSSEDGLFVVGGKVEICEPSIAWSQIFHFGVTSTLTLLEEHCIGGAQGKHGSRRCSCTLCISSSITNVDFAEVADVSSFVAFEKAFFVPWIVMATSAGAAISKVTELMDVEAVVTWG